MTYPIIGEYLWYDRQFNFRTKSRTLFPDQFKVSVLDANGWPDWNYDGSSTDQANGDYSEIILRPKCVVIDPFRHRHGISKCFIVLCDTYHPDGKPTDVNSRVNAISIFEKYSEERPWYGLEQEYFMLTRTDRGRIEPIGYMNGQAEKQGKYYCGVGHNTVFGRKLADTHYHYCLIAGLKMSGINAEVAPGQWEFQIGPAEGILAGDHLWIARYILVRLGEEFDTVIDFNPKPLPGDWNGSGCHTNFSTYRMRDGDVEACRNGLSYIEKAIENLSKKHIEHMEVYGTGNELRMTGKHETSDYNSFSSGVANRGASIRIPTNVELNGYGYFEDRRPSSNCDPYKVTSKILETSMMD